MKVPFITCKEVVYTIGRLRSNPNFMLSKARFPLFPSFLIFSGFLRSFFGPGDPDGQVPHLCICQWLAVLFYCFHLQRTRTWCGRLSLWHRAQQGMGFFQDFLEENDGKMASMARMARMAIEKSGGFAIQVDLERFLIWNLKVSEKPSRNPVQKSRFEVLLDISFLTKNQQDNKEKAHMDDYSPAIPSRKLTNRRGQFFWSLQG